MPRLTRLKADEEAGDHQPELIPPEIDGGQHLIDYLFEVGPGMSGEPLTFQEIGAWASQTGRALNAWEPVALRRLSDAYLAERQAAEDPARPAPGVVKPPVSRKVISDQLGAMFDRLERQDAKHAPPAATPRAATRNRPVSHQGFSKPVSEGEDS